MSELYSPTLLHTDTNGLYLNHFKFRLHRFPDLTFFVQSLRLPGVTADPVQQPTPFVRVPIPGDHLRFGNLELTYLVDAKFQTYFSLYYWMRGYGYPTSFEDVERFRAQEAARGPMARPTPKDLERSDALVSIVTPDTGSTIAEFHLHDVFPTEVGGLSFEATPTDTAPLVGTASFACSTFDVKMYV